MPLETGSFVNDLTVTNPAASDPVGQGDDHLRLIKTVLQGTFPNMGAVYGQVRSIDVATSISSTWNTNHIYTTNSATATVVLTLPSGSSITTGFYIDFTTLSGALSIVPSGADTVNGGASYAVADQQWARAYLVVGGAWLVDSGPSNFSENVVSRNAAFRGTVSISGAATFKSGASISGALGVSGAFSVGGAATFDGALSVSGAAVFKGAVTISGAATFNGSVTISGNATVNGALSLGGAATFGGTLTVSGNFTCKSSGSVSGGFAVGTVLTLNGGQISFPGTQNPSAGANVLDDYEEGTWTPVLTFPTPGDLSVAYLTQTAVYTKVGRNVSISMQIVTNTFTHSTASGQVTITGLPFSGAGASGLACAMMGGAVSGGTNLIVIHFVVSAATLIGFESGAGANVTSLTHGAMPSGTQQNISVSLTYSV